MYIHVPKEKRTKLDRSGRKGVFVGYSDTSKAYRIYFPGFKKIDINKDVTFIEEVEEPEGTRVRDMAMEEAIP